MRKSILIKNEISGMHRWPDAPDNVGFLRNPHRHVFTIVTEIEVRHDDRELEFFTVQLKIQSHLNTTNLMDGGSTSCEQLATNVARYVIDTFGEREVTCTVYEDNENAGRITVGGEEEEEMEMEVTLQQVQQIVAEDLILDLSNHTHSKLTALLVAGLCEEVGEVAGLYKRRLRQNDLMQDDERSRDVEWVEELGDVLWYLTAVCEVMGLQLSDVWQHNFDKLNRRYRDDR